MARRYLSFGTNRSETTRDFDFDEKTLCDVSSFTMDLDPGMMDECDKPEPTPPASVASDEWILPYRTRSKSEDIGFSINIHPSQNKDSVLVSVVPPTEPGKTMHHVPCDIVLAIDVSGSMRKDAPIPASNLDDAERNGLTVLDLTKHAARTILETLDENDRLGLVSFSTEAKVVQPLLPMTSSQKAETLRFIESLEPDSMTNLWDGLVKSIEIFEQERREYCVPAIMVLTDGVPNHMCPGRGYIPKLRSYNLPAAIHTFGFGYNLRSGLLKSIAEIGGGNYAFIPDSGMLGTVFVHAVANMQSTWATNVVLNISTSGGLKLSTTTQGCVTRTSSKKERRNDLTQPLTVPLDSIQYGQSRDILLRCKHVQEHIEPVTIRVTLDYTPVDGRASHFVAEHSYWELTSIAPSIVAYHNTRAEICNLIGSAFQLNSSEEYTPNVNFSEVQKNLHSLVVKFRQNGHRDESNASLLEDLAGDNPSGQIRLAVSDSGFFHKWGKHYLLSILNAHQKQICNSFKDLGPLQYGKHSPLFISCRDKLDRAFDTLPPPKPSNPPKDKNGRPTQRKVDMTKYHRKDNPCFVGDCKVMMADGRTDFVKHLEKGMDVMTPSGKAKIKAVVATEVEKLEMCVLGQSGELVITPWHPVEVESEWKFPCEITKERKACSGFIFSILLEQESESHAMKVGGHWVVTLGHGITDGADARAHEFWGDYDKIWKSLKALPESSGVLRSAGISKIKDRPCGFIAAKSLDAEHKGMGSTADSYFTSKALV